MCEYHTRRRIVHYEDDIRIFFFPPTAVTAESGLVLVSVYTVLIEKSMFFCRQNTIESKNNHVPEIGRSYSVNFFKMHTDILVVVRESVFRIANPKFHRKKTPNIDYCYEARLFRRSWNFEHGTKRKLLI